MKTKLTIALTPKTAASAKEYAKNHNTSVSKLVEAYLDLLTTAKVSEISPLVESLCGVIHVDETTDIKKDYTGYLAGKYK